MNARDGLVASYSIRMLKRIEGDFSSNASGKLQPLTMATMRWAIMHTAGGETRAATNQAARGSFTFLAFRDRSTAVLSEDFREHVWLKLHSKQFLHLLVYPKVCMYTCYRWWRSVHMAFILLNFIHTLEHNTSWHCAKKIVVNRLA
jgi:hypothetical protein